MELKTLLTALFLAMFFPVMGCAHSGSGSLVDVRVVSDNGSEYSQYRTYPRVHQQGRYFYMEAVKSERYSIRVSNRSDGQVGVVIAVDGRNIISGAKSDSRAERAHVYHRSLYHSDIRRMADRHGSDEQVLFHGAGGLLCGEGILRRVRDGDDCHGGI